MTSIPTEPTMFASRPKRLTLRLLTAAIALCCVCGVAAALPPQAEADMLMQDIGNAMKSGQYTGLPEKFQRISDLRANVPDSFEYHWGAALFNTGDYKAAMEHLERYISKGGSKAKYYAEALDRYSKSEKEVSEQRAKTAYLELLRKGIKLKALHCPDNEYYIAGVKPKITPEKVECLDISYEVLCSGQSTGITGIARNFIGNYGGCFGETYDLKPRPACAEQNIGIELREVRACDLIIK